MSIEIELEIYCTCGTKLEATVCRNGYSRNDITIEPCSDCLKEASDNGYDKCIDEIEASKKE